MGHTNRRSKKPEGNKDSTKEKTNKGPIKRARIETAKGDAGLKVDKAGEHPQDCDSVVANCVDDGSVRSSSRAVQSESHKSESSIVSSSRSNPLWKEQQDFLGTSMAPEERDNFFSNAHVSSERRAEIWSMQANLGEELVNRYSWATPDDRALRIIRFFAPIVEIGCGSNAYWCRQMQRVGINVIGYDKSPKRGGQIHQDGKSISNIKGNDRETTDSFVVLRGGPETLGKCQGRTLFLCYPDEDVDDEDESLAMSCLQHYKGEYIIHVGELFLDPTYSMEQAPWGRSSSPAFQERLAAEFHCILRVELPNWLHTADRLTVWKRSSTTAIAYADEPDKEVDDDDLEEVLYRHIPKQERLPVDIAAPCVAHLLQETLPFDDVNNIVLDDPAPAPNKPVNSKAKRSNTSRPKPSKRKYMSDNKSHQLPNTKESYTCPW